MNLLKLVAFFFTILFLSGCGDSGDSPPQQTVRNDSSSCDGTCPNQSLTADDVTLILQRAVAASTALNVRSTIAVTDRVGNVLGLYQMEGANPTTTIHGGIGASGGVEGATVPSALATISKAGTGAYLSSQGNAFTTRTAGQIIQENFNPGEENQPGGPLFGVQFSQLICSDITSLSNDLQGPRPLPLGLSADPGGIPLYKGGDPVGGIGVELDGVYGFDRDISDFDEDLEEIIALQGGENFRAPEERRGNRIFILGKSFRFTDANYGEDINLTEALPPLSPKNLLSIPGFTNGTIRGGATYGEPSSGITKSPRLGMLGSVITDSAGNHRFPNRNGAPLSDGSELKADEVNALLDSAFFTAFRTRGAIRNPAESQAHVTIFIVDNFGEVLGMTRTLDGPVFGIDVALQKARTAVFFSSPDAGDTLIKGGFGEYVIAARNFIGESALTGTHAFSDRAGGNLSRPFFPDGVNGRPNGPFSLPFPGTPGSTKSWSPFNTGLQLDIALESFVIHLTGAFSSNCTNSAVFGNRIRNGIQIFPGSVPLYRNGALIGGIGISGDGIDQDDLIAFFGVSREGLDEVGHTGIGDPILGFNAPPEIRADLIRGPVGETRLRYVNCPETPFRGSSEQQVCGGL